VNAVFSILFKAEEDAEAERYRFISERLGSAFKERVAGQAREIIKWQGGDHVGPRGFPCRRTTPFPFYISIPSLAIRFIFSDLCLSGATPIS
jgi:hypothetical protein